MGLATFIQTLNLSMTSSTVGNEVDFVETLEVISVPFNTVFADIPLPSQVLAHFEDGTDHLVDVEWLEGAYDEGTVGENTIYGNLLLTDPLKNTNNIQAVATVAVLTEAHSLFFTGASSQLVNFGTNADVQFLHTDPLCIAFWFKWPANPVTSNDVIITQLNVGSVGRGFEVQMRTTGHLFVELRNTSGTNFYTLETTGDFADNQWHHFIFNKSTTVASGNIWIDGIDVATTNAAASLSATIVSSDPIMIGGRQAATNFSDGYVDKVAIWDTTQSANVDDILNSVSLLDLAAPPIHYWEFDGGSYADTGTNAVLNGTPTNSPVFSTDVPVNSGDESFEYRIEEGDKDNISEEAGFFQWGGNVIEHGGTYYMIGNKWSNTDGFNGWVHYNRIYIGSSVNKLGPFSLVTEISVLRTQAWAANMVTNPNIIKIGSTYYLYYVGSHYSAVTYPVANSEARANQKIGVASASSPAGPWTPSANNPILSPSVSDWDQNVVNNPSVYVDGAAAINMVYKSDLNGELGITRLGKVKLTTWEGPVTDRSTVAPNFGLDVYAEDPVIWFEDGRYWAIFKAMDSSIIPAGHGILAVSDDAGATFRMAFGKQAYDLTIAWNDASSILYSNIERPFVLVEAGVATAIFNAVRRTNGTSFNVGIDLSARL